jgi:hypothetical protein
MPKMENEEWTPEEWVSMFNEQNSENQLIIARKVLALSNESAKCFMEDHDGAVKYRREHTCTDTYFQGWKDALSSIKGGGRQRTVD